MARKPANQREPESGGRTRAIIFAVVALVAGLSAVVVIYQLVQSYQVRIAEAKRPDPTVKAVIAARELFQGHPITEDDIVVADVPPQFLPGGSEKLVFASPEHVIGRVPRDRILPNEFLREQRLADPESGSGLNAIIPSGWRAISVNVKDGAALAGLLQPGSYVDVVVTIKPESGDGDRVSETHTLVQAVYVLAVNDKTERSTQTGDEVDPRAARERKKSTRKVKPSVTLAVRPQQAEAIAHAEKMGELTLTLRRIDEVEFVDNLSGATGDKIAGYEPEPEPVPEAKPQPKVTPKAEPKVEAPPEQTLQVIRGGKTSTVAVPNGSN